MKLPIVYILAGTNEQFNVYCEKEKLNPLFAKRLNTVEDTKGLYDCDVRYVGTYWEHPLFRNHIHHIKSMEKAK